MSNPDYQDLLEEIAELSQGLNTPLIALRTPQNMIGRDFTPPTAPPGMSENTHAVDRASQQGVSDMEQLGYRCLDGSDPDPSKVREIRTAFDEGERIKNGPTTHIQDGPVCYEVLESGIEERLEELAQRALHAEFVVSQGPVILGHNPDATDAGHKIAHPLGDDGISFIRLVCGAINTMVENKDGPTSEAFVIYESSHSVDHFDEDHAPSVRPAVAPYRLFELRGALRCSCSCFRWYSLGMLGSNKIETPSMPMASSIRRQSRPIWRPRKASSDRPSLLKNSGSVTWKFSLLNAKRRAARRRLSCTSKNSSFSTAGSSATSLGSSRSGFKLNFDKAKD
uniref:Cellobiose 2-epimerase n=1 Tax=Talaromyces marneffei PM1 TaxID=1077442 RepID=A0A093UXU5_TALMA